MEGLSRIDPLIFLWLWKIQSLLESIAKQICKEKNIEIEDTVSINALLKKAFIAIGYKNDTHITQISSALATIGQQIGNLRNNIGTTKQYRYNFTWKDFR